MDTIRIAKQLVAQKEALIKRAVANELGDEAPGLLDLVGRLSVVSRAAVEHLPAVECWILDNKHILTIFEPRYVRVGGDYRVIVNGEVHNEPEPESLPETGEYVFYRGPSDAGQKG